MDRFRDTLLALGLPGLFLIAVLDSAGLPLPGGVDIVLMLLAWQQPALFVVIALAAAARSNAFRNSSGPIHRMSPPDGFCQGDSP